MASMEPVVTRAAMRDGVELEADVYAAATPPGPVLLMRTPYDRRSDVTLVMFALERAVERGYAVVVQDTRGRFASAGVFAPFRSDIEDGYDTLEWLAAQPFCDGSVVMAGSSYLGATQWLAALSGHPALKAIAPALTGSDYYEGWTYQGGAFQLAFNLFWALVHLAPEERRRRGLPEPPRPPAPVYQTGGEQADWPAAQASMAVAGEWLRHRPLGDVPLHDAGPYYLDWLEHDDPASPYWEAIGPERHADRVACAVLAISGWYQLFLRGAYTGFAAVRASGASEVARERSALVLGPWQNSVPGPRNTRAGALDFGPAAGVDFEGLQLDFFDAALGRSSARTERVRYFVMGRNEWRSAAEWPPRGTGWTALYAHDGRLGLRPPADDGFAETRFDPADPAPTLGGCTVPGLPQGPRDHRAWLDRDDVAAYHAQPLTAPLEITGPVSAVVHVSADAESHDVVVLLAFEDHEGRLFNVCDGIARVRREAVVEVDLLATSIEVPAGARLWLLVGHASFPRFDVNTGLAEKPRYARAQAPVTRRLLAGTRILLPVVGEVAL
jgi:uncharacterized protein